MRCKAIGTPSSQSKKPGNTTNQPAPRPASGETKDSRGQPTEEHGLGITCQEVRKSWTARLDHNRTQREEALPKYGTPPRALRRNTTSQAHNDLRRQCDLAVQRVSGFLVTENRPTPQAQP